MGILSKDALLGASDLVEREVDLPDIGGSVRVRSLPAAYSNQAMSEALEVATSTSGAQTARVNTAKLEELQVLHGLIDPKLESVEEVHQLSQQVGRAWRTIVTAIDEISGVDKEAIEKTQQRFPAGGRETAGVSSGNGVGSGDGGSDLSVRAGGASAHDGE